MPIHRRLPKRGFTNIFKNRIAIINIGIWPVLKPAASWMKPSWSAGLVKGRRDGIKLLGQGRDRSPVDRKGRAVSQAAKEKIEAAGGKVEVI
jgi:large subunit ribosomal protein L15